MSEFYRDAAETLGARVEQLEAALRDFLDQEDTHEPGPYVKDGNYHPHAHAEKWPDGFQVCADEDCGRYWPCPVEELRRATGC